MPVEGAMLIIVGDGNAVSSTSPGRSVSPCYWWKCYCYLVSLHSWREFVHSTVSLVEGRFLLHFIVVPRMLCDGNDEWRNSNSRWGLGVSVRQGSINNMTGSDSRPSWPFQLESRFMGFLGSEFAEQKVSILIYRAKIDCPWWWSACWTVNYKVQCLICRLITEWFV
jgi:hypothetical protein